jgi:hypothetical protein
MDVAEAQLPWHGSPSTDRSNDFNVRSGAELEFVSGRTSWGEGA